MTTIKSYTDLEQSKRLIEILGFESADMHYYKNYFGDYVEGLYNSNDLKDGFELKEIEYIPCWSLSALFNILPDGTDMIKDKSDTENEKYMCTVLIKDSLVTTFANNPVDVCVEMLLKLDKLN